MKKKGVMESYYTLLFALLVGLMVLILVFIFIFQELFTEDDVNLEVCRQSIVARSVLPEGQLRGVTTVSFKDKYPLKCRNDVITIDYKNTTRAEKEFANALVACWHLYGNGDYGIFPSATWDSNGFCTFCARIHMNSDVKEFYEQGENHIDLSRAIQQKFRGDATYYEYLKHIGDEDPFKLVRQGDGFFGETFEMSVGKSSLSPTIDAVSFVFPQFFNTQDGDLFIVYQNFISAGGGADISQLLYFQERNARFGDEQLSAIQVLSDETKSNALVERIGGPLGWLWWDGRSSVCSSWDGIPV